MLRGFWIHLRVKEKAGINKILDKDSDGYRQTWLTLKFQKKEADLNKPGYTSTSFFEFQISDPQDLSDVEPRILAWKSNLLALTILNQ